MIKTCLYICFSQSSTQHLSYCYKIMFQQLKYKWNLNEDIMNQTRINECICQPVLPVGVIYVLISYCIIDFWFNDTNRSRQRVHISLLLVLPHAVLLSVADLTLSANIWKVSTKANGLDKIHDFGLRSLSSVLTFALIFIFWPGKIYQSGGAKFASSEWYPRTPISFFFI